MYRYGNGQISLEMSRLIVPENTISRDIENL